MKVIIAGGGWAGCAAALSAGKQGADVTLIERTDMLLGTGLVGGIMRNNGRFTATEEMVAMGGGDLFTVIDTCLRHKSIQFPGHEHADLYDIVKTPHAVYGYLKSMNIRIHFNSRINKIEMKQKKITGILDQNNTEYKGDVFIDATGTAGPVSNCTKYGNGCAMCIIRCPSFGGRISLTALAGIEELKGLRSDGSIGAMSGSCKIFKESLSQELIDRLNTKGVAIVSIPEELIEDHLQIKACQQYALKDFAKNLILLDTGHAKLMAPYYPLQKLNRIPGFEKARYEDPYGGSKGNSMRFFAMAPRHNTLQVKGMDNLFCAGEKTGLFVGHTEAIITGILAGYNSVRHLLKENCLTLPTELATGDAIAFVNEEMQTQEGLQKKYTFSGSCLFERMKSKNLYTIDIKAIKERVEKAGLTDVFA